MRTIYIDELVTIWKRTTVQLPDDVTIDQLKEKVKDGAANLLDFSSTEDWWQNDELLYDTEGSTILKQEFLDDNLDNI